jgi:PAS domain S-box-containing protein
LVDEIGTIAYASPSTTRILGYELDEYVGRSGFDFIHPDDRKNVREALESVLKEPGGTVNIQYRMKNKRGSWLWVEASEKNMLHDPIGAIIATQGYIRAEAFRRRAYSAKSYFQQLFESSPEGIAFPIIQTG